jgi:hypothetical protein
MPYLSFLYRRFRNRGYGVKHRKKERAVAAPLELWEVDGDRDHIVGFCRSMLLQFIHSTARLITLLNTVYDVWYQDLVAEPMEPI